MRGEADNPTLAQARARVEAACELLRNPTPAAMESCAAALAEAVEKLREWQRRAGAAEPPGSGAGPRCAALAEARGLQSAVRLAGSLLDSAARFHFRWRQAVGVLRAGYTGNGTAAQADPPGRVLATG